MYQLAAPAFSQIDIKKSVFHGQLYPVHSRAEAKAILATIRAAHPNAVHVCWALICEGDSGLDDDGEPSGTAAKPMYNVLVHKDLCNVLAVVVRYWGGIKLGAGGLTRAYGQAISEAFKTAELVEVQAMCERRFALQFADESTLRHLGSLHDISVVDARYEDQVLLTLRMKLSQAEEFERFAFNMLKGAVTFVDA
jgi:uncharacterized YigZ family protein